MPYEIVIGDISDLSFPVDVIVTMAHHIPGEIGNGVDRAIYLRVGDRMKEDRRRLIPAEGDKVIMSSAYNLKAKRLLHVLEPYYRNGKHGEREELRKCYDDALKETYGHHYRSIAFPLMSSGNNGFQVREAYRIAMHAFHEFCEEHKDMYVYLIIFDEKTIKYCETQQMNIRVDTPWESLKLRDAEEYPETRQEMYRKIRELTRVYTQTAEEIDKLFSDTVGKNAYETVCKLMDDTTGNLKCSEREICESVGISSTNFATHFRKPRKSPPTKQRLIAYAIAFKLNLNQTMELLNRAGYTLQPILVFDSIILKYIEQGKYDIISIDDELRKNGVVSLRAKSRKSKKTEEENSTKITETNCHNACDNKKDQNLYNGVHEERLPGQTSTRHGVRK